MGHPSMWLPEAETVTAVVHGSISLPDLRRPRHKTGRVERAEGDGRRSWGDFIPPDGDLVHGDSHRDAHGHTEFDQLARESESHDHQHRLEVGRWGQGT
jgi:hypothetical protein